MGFIAGAMSKDVFSSLRNFTGVKDKEGHVPMKVFVGRYIYSSRRIALFRASYVPGTFPPIRLRKKFNRAAESLYLRS